MVFEQIKTVASNQNAFILPRPSNKQNGSELKRRGNCYKMKQK